MKIKDLVHVPTVRTVIRVADLGEQSLRRHLVDSFVLTGEATLALKTILARLAAGRGQGFFVIGNYGSGKSHLLTILSLSLGDSTARDTLLAATAERQGGANSFASSLQESAARQPLVVAVSLVEHSNREYLENIVRNAVAKKLSEPGPADNHPEIPPDLLEKPRQEAFACLSRAISTAGYGGLVLLIDELSEFLRSRVNPRAYNEDIRFLQYLGESAESFPAWIVATMQENLENTGSLSGEMLHKIKDRYPVRLQLSGEHVKEIVSGRLVKKKDEAARALPGILVALQEAFRDLPFSRDDFLDLYPVHPATVEMLDELRPLFSQHRGVIDFIHHRLAGDAQRSIPPFLEEPSEQLLTPDYIFDHFRDRIRETLETSAYSEQVFHYYEREAGRLFTDPADKNTALRLVKLLILGAVSRAPQSFAPRQLAHLLLYRYSGLESTVNYEYIAEIMDKLQAHGAYIAREERAGGSPVYTIDLKADAGPLLERKIQGILQELAAHDHRILVPLLPLVREPYLPLQELQKEPSRPADVSWQNTRRTGLIFFGQRDNLAGTNLERFQEEQDRGEKEFLFILEPPHFPAAEDHCSKEEELDSVAILPKERLITWSPRAFTTEEEELLRQAYAHIRLQEEYSADNTPTGKQVNRRLEAILQEHRAAVRDLFRRAYFEGSLRAGGQDLAPATLGYVPFPELVSRCAAEVLRERYPRHAEIRPLSEQVSGSLMQRTLDLLFAPRLEGEELERGVRLVMENHLTPLGLVGKKGKDYNLEINPKKSPLLAQFLGQVPQNGRIALQSLYRHLAKGPFGLSADSFQALGMAAILSGAVTAYRSGRRLAPSQVNYYRFWDIEEIGPGTLIRPELQPVLEAVSFLPSRLRSGPRTFSAQQQTWEALIAFRVEWTSRAAEISRRLEQLRENSIFSSVSWDNLQKTLSRFVQFLEEIKTSYASREGLERFLAAYQSSPLIAADYSRLSALENFFSGDLPHILRLGQYLKNADLVIPPGKEYGDLRKRYRMLTELLEEEALLWEEEYRQRLIREFKLFREEYSSLYLAEHAAAVGPDRIKPYHTIMETNAYRVLEQMGRINTLVVSNDLVSVNRSLAEALEQECSAADSLRLAEHPSCSCPFRLGASVHLPGKNALEEAIIDGIRAYLQNLQAPEQARRIKAHAEHLELVGRRREAEPLLRLMELDPAADRGKLLQETESRLSPGTINTLNRALTGDAIIAERSMEELSLLLADRVFHTGQIREIVQRWIDGEAEAAPDYIRVTTPGKEHPGSPRQSNTGERQGRVPRAFLEEQVPRLVPAAARHGDVLVFALALLAGWLSSFLPPGEEEKQGRGDPPSPLPDLVRRQLNPPPSEEAALLHALNTLGEMLLAGEESLSPVFLEEAATGAMTLVEPEELFVLYSRRGQEAAHSFEQILELASDEPFFPALGRNLAQKMAARISAEESPPRLTTMSGMLQEAAGTLKKQEGPALTSGHAREKKAAFQVLMEGARCNLILNESERQLDTPPESDKSWERFYSLLAPFELILAGLEEPPEAGEIFSAGTLQRWRRRYASQLDRVNGAFSAYLEGEPPARRQSLAGLLRRLPPWASRQATPGGVYLLLIDGLRLDLWEPLLGPIFQEGSLQIQREGLLWALRPTVTEEQLAALREGELLRHIMNMSEKMVAELVSEPGEFLRAVDNSNTAAGREKGLSAVKYNFVDEKIHASRDSLPLLLEELKLQARRAISPLVENIPPGALILAAADHGFKTSFFRNPSDKDDPLYRHGGDSLHEVLAPWSLLYKV